MNSINSMNTSKHYAINLILSHEEISRIIVGLNQSISEINKESSPEFTRTQKDSLIESHLELISKILTEQATASRSGNSFAMHAPIEFYNIHD